MYIYMIYNDYTRMLYCITTNYFMCAVLKAVCVWDSVYLLN